MPPLTGRPGDASPTSTHNAPKLAILTSKIEQKILGREHTPLPWEGIPLITPCPIAASAARIATRPHPHQRFLDPPLTICALIQNNDVMNNWKKVRHMILLFIIMLYRLPAVFSIQ